ncbi:transcriptional regulator [Bordetella genomosp. 5]|uniref:helix-turn-helix domain-containing protein n=1 Tax=Bordetella genomosp. 5 TaxID=1395608 RepID=UPI000B9DFD90|nr:helix-turn-helix transcriptional regulator [Bordetella genomosp. 5]OZI44764.1 transcriptional regulator [Bordetella genomosp. 5]
MSPISHPVVSAGQLSAMLQAARKAKGWTQSELASRVGLSQSRISHLELNAHELSVEQLLAWCGALGLEVVIGNRAAGARADSATDW